MKAGSLIEMPQRNVEEIVLVWLFHPLHVCVVDFQELNAVQKGPWRERWNWLMLVAVGAEVGFSQGLYSVSRGAFPDGLVPSRVAAECRSGDVVLWAAGAARGATGRWSRRGSTWPPKRFDPCSGLGC